MYRTQDFKFPPDDTRHGQQVNNTGAEESKGIESLYVSLFGLETSGRHSRSGRSGGGSVSMATSQLGNHCKSKHEGDIKGMNDEGRRGGQSEMRDGR